MEPLLADTDSNKRERTGANTPVRILRINGGLSGKKQVTAQRKVGESSFFFLCPQFIEYCLLAIGVSAL